MTPAEKGFFPTHTTYPWSIRMSRTERCLVHVFKARMCALQPGDVLTSLSSYAPSGYRILVLARSDDGQLTLSLQCEDFRLVADPKGPFRWLEEAETLVDRKGNPHELIDLGTQVDKGTAVSLVAEYAELAERMKAFEVLSEERIREIMSADSVLRRHIDAALFNEWLPTTRARVAAALELIFGRPLTGNEQAYTIALISCLARAVPVLDVTILRGDSTAEAPSSHATH